MADLLIVAGANVKVANRDGATPLYLASIGGSAPMMEKLLKAGADPNERGPEGETPHYAGGAERSSVDALKVLLDNKADVNAIETNLRGTTAVDVGCGTGASGSREAADRARRECGGHCHGV